MFKRIKEFLNPAPKYTCPPEQRYYAERGISEPVFSILKAWQEDKDRFTFKYKVTVPESFHSYIKIEVHVLDTETEEQFNYTGNLTKGYTYTSAMYLMHGYSGFGWDVLCPCDGVSIYDFPRWLTFSEIEYLKEQMFPYYQERVARYRDIIKYRSERKLKSAERNSQIAKDKERNRLTKIYGEQS